MEESSPKLDVESELPTVQQFQVTREEQNNTSLVNKNLNYLETLGHMQTAQVCNIKYVMY